MWTSAALLVVFGWTGVGLVSALIFFRLGFGFEARRDGAEHIPQAPEPDVHRHRAADPSYALAPVDLTRRRRGWRGAEPQRAEHDRGRWGRRPARATG